MAISPYSLGQSMATAYKKQINGQPVPGASTGLPSPQQATAANGAANAGFANASSLYQQSTGNPGAAASPYGNVYPPPSPVQPPAQPQPPAAPPPPPGAAAPAPNQPTAWGNTGISPALEDAWNQYGGQFGSVGGNSLSILGQAQDQLGGPSASQGFYGTASGQLGGPGAAESLYSQLGGQYGQATPLQNLSAANPFGQAMGSEGLGALAPGMLGPANTQGFMGFASAQTMGRPVELQQQGDRIDAGYMGADNVQRFAGQNAGTLNGPGQLEQFAASALTGDNPYANLLRQEGMDAINQQMAARGAYGAGGALGALAKYNTGLDAQLFQQMGALQGNAQNATMNRMGLGADIAGAASGERMSQFGALQGLANDTFNQRMGAVNTGIGAAGAADASNVARLAGQVNASTAGDQIALARLAGQAGLARDTTNSNLNYLNSQFQQANSAQQNQLARLGLGGALANQVDSTQINRINALGGLAGQTDQLGLAGLNSMFGAAGQTQGAQRDRLNDALANMLPGLGTSLYGPAYAQGGAYSGAMDAMGINAGVNAAGLEGQGQNAGTEAFWNLINMGQQNLGQGGKMATGGR